MLNNLSVILLISALATGISHAFEEPMPRYALIIGNADYLQTPLANAKNDAMDMPSAFESLKYQVKLELDLQLKDFTAVVRRFYHQIESPKASTLFYYAGRALQVGNTNYLIPVNADITDVESLLSSAFVLDQLLYMIKQSSVEQSIIILDACRDNPYEDGLGEAQDSLTKLSGGLAPANTLVAYSTQPGSVSSDGNGRNGVYTSALLRHIKQPIPAEALFQKIRKKEVLWEVEQSVAFEKSLISLTPIVSALLLAPSQETKQ